MTVTGCPSGILVITGTGTGVGKTVVAAAVAAVAVAAGRRVAVLKPAQTGLAAAEPGDTAEVSRLCGAVTTRELARYPDPLAPATAARLAGLAPVTPAAAACAAAELARTHDLVLVEGAGGLLVRLTDGATGDTGGEAGDRGQAVSGPGARSYDVRGGGEGAGTLADIAAALRAPVLVVVAAGLGTLNATALTVEALRTRGLGCAGVVIGSWPAEPDLACRCNLVDLPRHGGAPLVGMLPAGAAALGRSEFLAAAAAGLAPSLGGRLDVTKLSPALSDRCGTLAAG